MKKSSKKIVMHIITGLNNGGAEAVLYRLISNDQLNSYIVVSMMDEGKYGEKIKKLNIPVYCLNMPIGKITLKGICNLWDLIKKINPDVVQTWMYHADLVGGVIAKLQGIKNINWGLHNTTLSKTKSKKATRIVAKLNALLSHNIPKNIIACAEEASIVHKNNGYSSKKITVIPNGYSLSEFVPIKRELVNNKFTIGMVARFHPQKDHKNIIDAIGILTAKQIQVRCILVGPGVDHNNKQITDWIKASGCQTQIELIGQRSDIPQIMNTLDLHILSSSFGEAFPNVLAEAMACGIPCVTTNVGDAALIVGGTGWVVPHSNSQALANAILVALKEKEENFNAWQARKQAARKHIVDNFSIECMVAAYNQVWREAVR